MSVDGPDSYEVFQSACATPVTLDRYTRKLKYFFRYMKLQGSLKEQCKIFYDKASIDITWANRVIGGFVQNLRQRVATREITAATMHDYTKPIKFFCNVNFIDISWKRILIALPKARKRANDRAPTTEEVAKIMEYPDRRLPGIVTTMVSSGIRVGAWDYLKWGHIQPIYQDDKLVAAKILVYAEDEDHNYFSFITPEAYLALEKWMEFRKKAGEVVTKDSWLMRKLWDVRNTAKGKRQEALMHPSKLTAETGIAPLVDSAIWAAGLRTSNNHTENIKRRRYEFQARHGFRKFFKTHAEQVMHPLNVELLMGHRVLPGLGSHYYRPTEEQLLEDYLKVVDNLTINKSPTEDMIRNQQALTVEMQTKDREIKELKAQQQEIKDRFEAYESKMAEFIYDIKARLNLENNKSQSELVEEVFSSDKIADNPRAKKLKEQLRIYASKIDAEDRQRDLELQKQRKVLLFWCRPCLKFLWYNA
jgi:integrase